MIPDSDEELLQRELDGENPAPEAVALRKRLAAEPELRDRYSSLARAVRAVAHLPWLEAPEGLAQDVMRRLRRHSLPSRTPALAGIGRRLVWRPVLAYGTALAAGLLLGAFLFGPAGRGRAPGSEGGLAGTALPGATIAQPPASDVLQLAEGPLRARVVTRVSADGIRLELAIQATAPVDGTIRFDPAVLRARAVELARHPEGGALLGPGQVELRQVREGTYGVVLEGTPAGPAGAVSVRLESQGRVVEGRIGANPGGGEEG